MSGSRSALDAAGAAPVAGSRLGEGDEELDVDVSVVARATRVDQAQLAARTRAGIRHATAASTSCILGNRAPAARAPSTSIGR